MDLRTAVDRIETANFKRRHDLDVEIDELVTMAVRRLVAEPFEVLAKGLNPSRFDSWSKGARSKVARRFGSSSDLMLEVLRRAIAPERGEFAAMLSLGAEVIDSGVPYQDVLHDFALAFFDRMLNDDGVRVQFYASIAAPNRGMIAEELGQMYENVEGIMAAGMEDILRASNRRALPDRDIVEEAGNIVAMIEGAVLQGSVRDEKVIAARFARYVVFLMESASEPIE